MLNNLFSNAEIRIPKALAISRHSALADLSSGFLSYDLVALGFLVVTFLHGSSDTTFKLGLIYKK